MWGKDEPETLSIEQWRGRERKRGRRSFVIFALMAVAFTAGLMYVGTHP